MMQVHRGEKQPSQGGSPAITKRKLSKGSAAVGANSDGPEESGNSDPQLEKLHSIDYCAPTFGSRAGSREPTNISNIVFCKESKNSYRKERNQSQTNDAEIVTDPMVAYPHQETLTDRGPTPTQHMPPFNRNRRFQMKARVGISNMPDCHSGTVDLTSSQQQGTEKSAHLAKQLQLKRGLQGFSPRTSKRPIIKELD